jgi:hypothetical protein
MGRCDDLALSLCLAMGGKGSLGATSNGEMAPCDDLLAAFPLVSTIIDKSVERQHGVGDQGAATDCFDAMSMYRFDEEWINGSIAMLMPRQRAASVHLRIGMEAW